MANREAVQLVRIARLRRFVGVFARGGDRDAAAEALGELAYASLEQGNASEALARARQAAQLLADDEASDVGVRALIQLGTICLETGAPDAAASAADLSRERASKLPGASRGELLAGATLLAGLAHAMSGDEQTARASLSEARDLLVAAGQPAGAALALVQQGMLDIGADHLDGAEVCFAFARDFYRAAGLPGAAVEAAGVVARAFSDAAASERADRWFALAIAEADRMGMLELAAELLVERAADRERAGSIADAVRLATESADRCALLAAPAADALRSRVHMQLARLVDEPREGLRHLEAAFELGLAGRASTTLGTALDTLVSGLATKRFPEDAWRTVELFRDRLTSAGFDALAEIADRALADVRA